MDNWYVYMSTRFKKYFWTKFDSNILNYFIYLYPVNSSLNK